MRTGSAEPGIKRPGLPTPVARFRAFQGDACRGGLAPRGRRGAPPRSWDRPGSLAPDASPPGTPQSGRVMTQPGSQRSPQPRPSGIRMRPGLRRGHAATRGPVARGDGRETAPTKVAQSRITAGRRGSEPRPPRRLRSGDVVPLAAAGRRSAPRDGPREVHRSVAHRRPRRRAPAGAHGVRGGDHAPRGGQPHREQQQRRWGWRRWWRQQRRR